MARHFACLQFTVGGPAVEGEWASAAVAAGRYTEWVGFYGSRPSVLIRLIEETEDRCWLRRT